MLQYRSTAPLLRFAVNPVPGQEYYGSERDGYHEEYPERPCDMEHPCVGPFEVDVEKGHAEYTTDAGCGKEDKSHD